MELSEILKNVTINVNVNISDEAARLLVGLLSGSKNIVVNNSNGAAEKPSKKDSAKRHDAEKKMDIHAIAEIIREYVKLVEAGEDINETSAILADEIKKMSGGRIKVYLAFFGRFRAARPNLRNTPEVAALFDGKRWNGFCRLGNLENILNEAFYGQKDTTEDETENETSALSGAYRHSKKVASCAHKNFFRRVKKGSGEICIRRSVETGSLAPMVIDSEIASELYNNSFTNVKLGAACKMENGVLVPKADGSLNLIFSREDRRTRAPQHSHKFSRLRPHGHNNNTGGITTYVINGEEFQDSILRHFKSECREGQECVFSLLKKSSTQDKVAYEIKFKETV